MELLELWKKMLEDPYSEDLKNSVRERLIRMYKVHLTELDPKELMIQYNEIANECPLKGTREDKIKFAVITNLRLHPNLQSKAKEIVSFFTEIPNGKFVPLGALLEDTDKDEVAMFFGSLLYLPDCFLDFYTIPIDNDDKPMYGLARPGIIHKGFDTYDPKVTIKNLAMFFKQRI